MQPTYFDTQAAFRNWLTKYHATETELVLGFYKKDSKHTGIKRMEAVDEALCFGWIDGITKSVDEDSYTTRFTPRKKRSHWSNVNIKRVAELKGLGLMKPAGIAAFEAMDAGNAGLAAFEQEEVNLSPAQLKTFKANKAAWEYFDAQGASYKKSAMWWVISAKQEATKAKRLATLIDDSTNGRKLKQFSITPKKPKL